MKVIIFSSVALFLTQAFADEPVISSKTSFFFRVQIASLKSIIKSKVRRNRLCWLSTIPPHQVAIVGR
jgi:hypothetical protein